MDLAAARKRLRLSADVHDDEIQSLMDACLTDLRSAGAEGVSLDDPLTETALTLFLKAQFGYEEQADKYDKRYQALKISMANDATDYGASDEGADSG